MNEKVFKFQNFTNKPSNILMVSTWPPADKCISSQIHIVMTTDKEIVGTVLCLDDFVNMVEGG
uniref:LSM domain-containing protein n=1 Tax=Oryzias melastigma TaxID=30732 RepID=A0A3B3DUG4_ORYME